MIDVDSIRETEWLFKSKNFLCYGRLPSTQDRAKELIKNGACKPGHVIIADEQYSGRGRFGSPWRSEKGASLTFSIIVENVPLLPMRAALSVLETLLDKCRISAEIRWPNDIVVKGKKLCGILVETYKQLAVVGVGLNVNETSFSLKGATSIRLETGKLFSREPILSYFLQTFEKTMKIDGVMELVRPKLSLINSLIEFETEYGIIRGEFLDLGDEGEILVRTESGIIKGFAPGEVKNVRRTYSMRTYSP